MMEVCYCLGFRARGSFWAVLLAPSAKPFCCKVMMLRHLHSRRCHDAEKTPQRYYTVAEQ